MDKIKKIFVDWFEKDVPKVIDRKFDYSLLNLNKIISFIGVRRSGKTSFLYQIMNYLIEKESIDRNNLIYINFEDDRLFPLEGGELDSILEDYKSVVDYNEEQNIYLFLDEVQNIENWSRWVRRLQDTKKNLKIVVTGSSAKLLSREIATELSGRTISQEVFPLSFKEFLFFNNFEYDIKSLKFSSKKGEILKLFDKFVKNGGFPEVVLDDTNKQIVLQGYFDSIFYKDLVLRHNIKSIKMFEDFLRLLIANVSNRVSLSKLENTLKSLGYKVSKSTLSEYLHYAREVYFIFNIPVYSFKIKDLLLYPKKIYSIDVGLNDSVSVKSSENVGNVFENVVYLELLRRGYDIYYFISKNNLECDFVIKEDLKYTKALQVSFDVSNEDTKKREIKALISTLKELDLGKGVILTYDYFGEEEIYGKKIDYIPIWYWLLS